MIVPIVTAKAMNAQKIRPTRVNLALAALWLAWTVSLVALLLNHLVFKGSEIGPGWALGILSLTVQGALFILVGRGNRIARDLTIVFLVLAVLPLPIVGRLISEKSIWSATYLAIGFGLKAVAVFLLFTAETKDWFAS